MRFRHVFFGIGSILTVMLLLASDPDNGLVENLPFGAGTLTILIVLVSSILYIGLLHIARKGLMDYLDLESMFKNATRTPEGSGLALIAVGLIMVAVAITIMAATS